MIYQKIKNETDSELKEISFEEAIQFAGTGTLVFDSQLEEMNFYKEVIKKYPPSPKILNVNKKNELEISELLPFLGRTELHQIVLSIINDDENSPYENFDLEELFPYLNNEDIELLFLNGCSEKSKIDLVELAPFVSTKTFTIFVDEYLKGNYHHVDVNELYPFMSSADIKRLFDYFLEQRKNTSNE